MTVMKLWRRKKEKILKRHFPEKNKTLSAAPLNLHHNFFFAELQHYCSREQFSTLCVIPVINLLKGNGSNFPEWWTSPYYIFQGYDIGAKRYFFLGESMDVGNFVIDWLKKGDYFCTQMHMWWELGFVPWLDFFSNI